MSRVTEPLATVLVLKSPTLERMPAAESPARLIVSLSTSLRWLGLCCYVPKALGMLIAARLT